MSLLRSESRIWVLLQFSLVVVVVVGNYPDQGCPEFLSRRQSSRYLRRHRSTRPHENFPPHLGPPKNRNPVMITSVARAAQITHYSMQQVTLSGGGTERNVVCPFVPISFGPSGRKNRFPFAAACGVISSRRCNQGCAPKREESFLQPHSLISCSYPPRPID